MPDPHATDRSAPASPLPSVASEGKGAENERARIIDDVRCPNCHAATLVTGPLPPDGQRFRYCSYVSCAWGLEGHDVFYEDSEHVYRITTLPVDAPVYRLGVSR